MKFIDPIISFSTVKHPGEGAIFKLGFKKGLKQRSPTLLKSKYFLILFRTVSFLFALMQILVKCLSNFNVLLIVIPNCLNTLPETN